MGLQDTLVMSAVSAHDVTKSRTPSAQSAASSSKTRTPALEESLLALTLRSDQGGIGEDCASNNSVAEDMDYQQEIDFDEDSGDEDWEGETEDAKLSKALRSWMCGYVITPLPPRVEALPHVPLFSARLGQETNIRRAPSAESITTQLSLFSCSSYGLRKRRERKRRRLRRKKTTSADRRQGENPEPTGHNSRWVELARKRKGELDRFMMAQSYALTQGVNLMDESEAFQLCDADEQSALHECGQRNKLEFAAQLKKSDSMTNLKDVGRGKARQRVSSAGAKRSYGKPIDFRDLHRQMVNQRLASLTSHSHRRTPGHSRRSMHRSHSRLSLASVSSAGGGGGGGGGGSGDVFLSATTPCTDTSSLSAREKRGRRGAKGQREAEEKNVSMWKGDSQILAIDLNRELTSKVKQRIAVTTTALERVTGVGDDNERRPYTCHLDEFPAYIDEDFAVQPRIPQRMRISPHLSAVIKTDIRVRMGRPRYHEIRVHDMAMWNRGQQLDRAHRNLKVFNWLHSLKEDEFQTSDYLQQTIHDVPPDRADVTFGDMVLIRAADEPDVKPLYEQKKMYIR